MMLWPQPLAALNGTADPTQQTRPPALTDVSEKTENQATIDRGILLLEYLLGEQSSVLWAVTSDSVNLYELPGRAVIEKAAQRVSAMLTAKLRRDNETIPEAIQRAARSR